MTWRGSIAELAYYERMRDGGSPKLEIIVHGELCYLVTEPNTGDASALNRKVFTPTMAA
jgi:hypothetical protein